MRYYQENEYDVRTCRKFQTSRVREGVDEIVPLIYPWLCYPTLWLHSLRSWSAPSCRLITIDHCWRLLNSWSTCSVPLRASHLTRHIHALVLAVGRTASVERYSHRLLIQEDRPIKTPVSIALLNRFPLCHADTIDRRENKMDDWTSSVPPSYVGGSRDWIPKCMLFKFTICHYVFTAISYIALTCHVQEQLPYVSSPFKLCLPSLYTGGYIIDLSLELAVMQPLRGEYPLPQTSLPHTTHSYLNFRHIEFIHNVLWCWNPTTPTRVRMFMRRPCIGRLNVVVWFH